MNRQSISISEISKATGKEVDEILILLWDRNLGRYNSPNDVLTGKDFKIAQSLFGLASKRELVTPLYWRTLLNLDDVNFHFLMNTLDIALSTNAKVLPKGAIKKLRQLIRKRLLPPAPLAPPCLDSLRPIAVASKPSPEPAPTFEWRTVGKKRNPTHLTPEQIESIHHEIAMEFANTPDPIEPVGVRDQHLLGGATYRSQTSIGTTLKYPTAELASAALLHSLIHNHPFHNGNKRTALVSMLVMLDECGLVLTCREEDIFPLLLRIAQHHIVPDGDSLPDREVLWVAEWICANSRDIESGEQPIPWRKLMQILNGFGCKLDYSKGGKVNITRTVTRKRGWFGTEETQTLHTQIRYIGQDSRDVPANTTHMIRRDLHLDDEHNVDSYVFYRKAGTSTTDFIHEYRKTLKRLARV